MVENLERRKTLSYVYFITDSHGHIKIGKANDTMARLKELQTGNPYPLTPILNIFVDSEEVAFGMESALHKKFRNFQMEGEWFRAEPVMQVIDKEIVTIGKYRFGGLRYGRKAT